MSFLPDSALIHTVSGFLIAAVWIFHGLYSKLLNGIPRHRQIVARVLGPRIAGPGTKLIGAIEVLLGVWVLSGQERVLCASVQTAALVGMNTLEILLASDLLISSLGMIALNLGFLAVVWNWALSSPRI